MPVFNHNAPLGPVKFGHQLAAEVTQIFDRAGYRSIQTRPDLDGRDRVVEATLDKMSSNDGLQNASITLDNVLETDRLARIRAGEAIGQLG